MVQAHEVQNIVIVNNEFVEVTLTAKALEDPKYRALFADKPYFGNTGAQFQFEITSADKFLDDFQKLKPDSESIDYEFDRRSDGTGFLSTWGFLIIMILAMYFLLGRMTGGGGPGGQIFNIGRSKATLFDAENKVKITFSDVAGLEEAKEEIMEIVDYLKNPTKFTKLGAKIPKGALLVGVLQLNQTAADLAGLPAAGLVGRAPDEMHPQALADAMRADMQAALAAATVTKREYSIGAHGQERLWDARYLPLGASGEAPDQLLLVATDVTEQRAAQEARLAAAIAQREMLVKEVHHRIKNNLQGVAGLLQQIAARRPEVQSVISEVVGQVQAIAQVYGLQVGAAGPLRLTSVVEAITNSVQRTFGRTIALEVEEPDAAAAWGLPEAESIPIALTINELLTNAIKHSRGSFDDVRCTLACEAQGVRVVISNPGLLGPDFKLAHIPGGVSGLGLVRALMPRRSATLAIEQQGPRVVATVALVPPGVLQLEPAASEGEGARSATIAV